MLTIEKPHRIVHVCAALDTPIDWEARDKRFLLKDEDSGETLVAQVERGPRTHDDLVQIVHMYGAFRSPVRRVSWSMDPDADVPEKAFQWTPSSTQAARRYASDCVQNAKSLSHGHALIRRRYHNFGSIFHISYFSGIDCIWVDSIKHSAHVNDEEAIINEFDSPYLIGQSLPQSYMPQRARRRAFLVLPGPDNQTIRPGDGWVVDVDSFRRNPVYGANGAYVPDFGKLDIPGRHRSDRNKAEAALRDGTPYPAAYKDAVGLGMWHPCLSKEGGETGGTWISQCPGIDLAARPTVDGLYLALYEQHMALSRTHIGMLDSNGRPLKYEDFAADKSWSMRSDDGRFDKASGGKVLDGPFGWSAQPPVSAPEKAALDAFEPFDFAHFIRLMGHDIKLAYLWNDSMSRELIAQNGELVRFSFLPRFAKYKNSASGKGAAWNRTQGWMFRAMAEAYAFGSNELRKRFDISVYDILAYAKNATMSNGCLSADTFSKQYSVPPYSKQYAVTVSIHEGLLRGGLHALARVFGSELVFNHSKHIRYMLHGSNVLWSVASRNLAGVVYETIPNDAQGNPISSAHPSYDTKPGAAVDSEQSRAVLGYDLDMALVQTMLGPNPIAALQAMNWNVCDSDAILLGALQAQAVQL